MKRYYTKKKRLSCKEPGIYSPGLMLVPLMLVAMGTIWACAYLKPIDEASRSPRAAQNKLNPTPVYHDFDDILVPRTMRINRKMTAITETHSLVTGVISFAGNMNRKDIIQFFKINMVKDNWTAGDQLIGQRSLLQFEKHNRWCLLTITESPSANAVQLEIWVIPKIDAPSSGLLK